MSCSSHLFDAIESDLYVRKEKKALVFESRPPKAIPFHLFPFFEAASSGLQPYCLRGSEATMPEFRAIVSLSPLKLQRGRRRQRWSKRQTVGNIRSLPFSLFFLRTNWQQTRVVGSLAFQRKASFVVVATSVLLLQFAL